MIKLTKSDAPKILETNFKKWTDNILAKLARNEALSKTDKGHYGHREIKNSLISETNGKCAYCESKLRHITYGDVEHITPKIDSPELWFSWENLTLACDVCNTNKSNKKNLIDPYTEDPDDHIIFLGAAIFHVPGNERAELSIRTLDLNREELLGRRKEKIEELWRRLELIEKAKDPELKKVLSADFNFELTPDKEYAALAHSLERVSRLKGLLL